ncbi:hypothetical protein MBLNU230_g8240t1 [Neophaeotheca triangularis]
MSSPCGLTAAEAATSAPQEDGQDAVFQQAAARIAQEAQQQPFSYGKRKTTDITTQFTAASKELPSGQLVKDEYFTLFEAVGALEIMDSKMDSGFIEPGDTIEPTFDVCAPITAEQATWILDELLCLEAAWHDGYPLSQTLFTSLHMDRLLSPDNWYPYDFNLIGEDGEGFTESEKVVQGTLRTYCLATIKCCEIAMQTIQSQHYYEEEDFVTHLFGRELIPGIGEDEVVGLLEDALLKLSERTISSDLLLRLEWRRDYLLSLQGQAVAWLSLGRGMDELTKSRSTSTPTPTAFSDKVQRELATSTPPRPMLRTSWDNACKQWKKLFADVQSAYELTQPWTRQNPACLQRATWAFSARQGGTFARSVMQGLLFNEGKVLDVGHYDLLLSDLRDLVLAGDSLSDPESYQVEVTSDARHKSSRIMEMFLDKAIEEYMNLYRMVCQNRCRIRRTFTQSVPLLYGLQEEATKHDEMLNEVQAYKQLKTSSGSLVPFSPLTWWTKHHRLQVMSWVLQLGIETDIYLPDELAGIYWHLSLLTQHRLVLYSDMELFLLDRMRTINKTNNTQYAADSINSQDYLHSLRASAQATLALATALWKLYRLLMSLGTMPVPKRSYASAHLLHEARMKSFLCIPEPRTPSHVEVSEAVACPDVAADIEAIDQEVKAAKTHLATLKQKTAHEAKYVGTEDSFKREVKQLETTAVAVAVALSQVKRTRDKAEGGDERMALVVSVPLVSKRYHAWWAVPQVQEK